VRSPLVPTNEGHLDGRRIAGALFVIGLAVVLLALPGGAQQRLATVVRTGVLRPFLALQEGLVSARLRSIEAGTLQARIDSLSATVLSYSGLIEEHEHLLDLLDLSGRVGPRWTAARALRLGSTGVFALDAGSRDSVADRAPVVTGEGLVGVVREVQLDRSVAMDWSHPDFRAAAMNRSGTVFGIVQARPALFGERGRMLLTGAPFTTPIEVGTVIVTSGAGGVFPRGIPIGRVGEVAESRGGWQRSYWVDPFVDPGDVTQTLVATTDSVPLDELSDAWRPREIGSPRERELALGSALDSLALLRDSLVRLERRIEELERVREPELLLPDGGPR
jgi:rod shape-determining protein MreC